MAPRRRPGRRLLKALLPLLLVPLLAAGGFSLWLVYGVARPQTGPYMMTPETFGLISERGLQVKEEKWTNRDGTEARGWLLRGTEGAPAVVMLHHYDSNRSAFLNLGVQINESTNYTILWPDLRGHGEDPPVAATSFGAREADDLLDAIEFLRGLKTPQEKPLVGGRFGVYGVELGAYASLLAAKNAPDLRALVLDSAPDSADDILYRAVRNRKGLDNTAVHALSRLGARIYFLGGYQNTHGCTLLETLGDRRVLFISGADAGPLKGTTETLARCFPNPSNVELRSDLPLTGFTQSTAPGQQSETYARVVIDFLTRALPPR